jgi:Flp pilus assembly protein TadD
MVWILATTANPEFRNGPEAVRMAERACELTGQKDSEKLKTLAAAYAEAGRFPEAITTAQSAQTVAVTAGRKQMAGVMETMLENFKAAKPWRAAMP